MTNPYNRAGLRASGLRKLALAALLTSGATVAQAALPYVAANVLNTSGTYTDLGTTGTAIATANTDDANSAVQTIPFTFTYNGTAYTQFTLNTNGYIRLGAAAPTAPFFNDGALTATNGPVTGPDTDLILPFNTDLAAGSAGGTEYRMAVSGTAPNQVLTIQWKNVSDKPKVADPTATPPTTIATQYANFSFQVKLYENNSQIDFVYGTATAGAAATENPKYVNVGIKGSNATVTDLILGVKPSAQPWTGTAFTAGPYTGNAHNVRRSVLPSVGRTYSFTLPIPVDAAVQLIYGYGKLLTPAGQPVTLQALVRNAGTSALSNINVTLSVAGANTVAATTQVVNSLAVGATSVVTFPAIALPNAGLNTITVSVPADGNTGNDVQTLEMTTDATTTSYIYPGIPQTSSYGFTPAAASFTSAFGAKFTLASPRDIVGVNAVIGSDANLVGSTVFGVVADITTGAILGRSADYVLTAADLGVLHTFTLPAAPQLPAGDFLAGLAQVVPTGSTQVFPAAYQAENPARTGAYYTFSVSTPAAPRDGTANNARYMLEIVTAAPATCPPPTGVTGVPASPTSATITFTGPANASGYELVYGAPGFNPATGGTTSPTFTTSPYTLPGLTSATCYDVYVRAVCSATDRSNLAGPVSVCTPCTPPIITTYPYTQDFNTVTTGQALPCGITVADSNSDTFTWEALATVPTATNPNLPIGNGNTGNAMVYFYNADGVTGANDWFFSPAMLMTAGRTYRVSFALRSAGTAYPEGLEVKYGSAATPAGQTNTIYTNTAVINAAYAPAAGVTDITIPTGGTGTYYIGFHATSAADKFFLAVDDFVVTQVLASSAALTRALSVFPNPSASGQFNLEVRGANAAQGLNVEVTNMLGQTVYTGKAKDNFTNSLNLTSLASGIYTLKVKNGNEYSVQQISIVK